MAIEADRQAIEALPIDVEMMASLRETARLRATHYSTQIEGNRLTEVQVQQALRGAQFPGRERDETEVRNYYRALEEVELLAQLPDATLTEAEVQSLHGWVPEAQDVPELMADLVTWIRVLRGNGRGAGFGSRPGRPCGAAWRSRSEPGAAAV